MHCIWPIRFKEGIDKIIASHVRETNSVVPMEVAHYFETSDKIYDHHCLIFCCILQIITIIYITYWI